MFSFFISKSEKRIKAIENEIQYMMDAYTGKYPTLLSKTQAFSGEPYMEYFRNVLVDEHHPLLAKDHRKTRFTNDNEYLNFLLKTRDNIYSILSKTIDFQDVRANIRNDKLNLIMSD